MDYEMETLIQALVIQINMVWNQFHEIIHELIRYAHALGVAPARDPGICATLEYAVPLPPKPDI